MRFALAAFRAFFAAITTAVLLTGGPSAHAAVTPAPKAAGALALPTLYLIGDSTVNNHTKGLLGWGDPVKGYFDPGKIRVENRARGGRSSRSYYTEGLWAQVARSLKPGDFVLMQFGHNDGGPLAGPRGRASLKGNGDETREIINPAGKPEVVHTYGWYLRKYVADTRAAGATPIVLSPIPRNIWIDDHNVARNFRDYGKWAAEAAREGGAFFIDLNDLVATVYDRAGRDTVAKLCFTPTDHTHMTPAGAEVNARCVFQGIRALEGCRLRDDLVPGSPVVERLPAASGPMAETLVTR